MNYKKRNSESNHLPELVESLQDGKLYRFNINEDTRRDDEGQESIFYTYVEFWFPKNSSRQEISAVVESYGYVFGDGYNVEV